MTAATPEPQRAPVRPRVRVAGGSVPRLFEEEIAELLAKGARTVVELVGPPASGRTMALQHLAATFAGDPRLGWRDSDGIGTEGSEVTVVAVEQPAHGGVVFVLAPWTDDDVLEYLVHRDRGSAGVAFANWRAEPFACELTRLPALCRAVLDVMSTNEVAGPLAALRTVIDQHFDADQREDVRQVAWAHSLRHEPRGAPELPLLAAPIVRGVLAAEAMFGLLAEGSLSVLPTVRWSPELIAGLRSVLAAEPAREERLRDLLLQDGEAAELPRLRHRQSEALSVLCAVHPGFRPPMPRLVTVPHVHFPGADLHGLELRGSLDHADLRDADLRCADLQGVLAHHACFDRARLDAAHLDHLQARRATGVGMVATRASLCEGNLFQANLRASVFDGAILAGANLGCATLAAASLREADLREANLCQAILTDADLTGACCLQANFVRVDLRATKLAGATLGNANLEGADLSGQQLPGLDAPAANFKRAWLTGTLWQNGRLVGSTFAEAGLAAIDWEGADLRHCDFTGAAFHLGSSRSGLVPGAVASEGTRTGFYTDESLEDRFQAPEEVRKANLCGCDMRGALVVGCDFYLVDLRGALLDDGQRDWLRRCRAILDP